MKSCGKQEHVGQQRPYQALLPATGMDLVVHCDVEDQCTQDVNTKSRTLWGLLWSPLPSS